MTFSPGESGNPAGRRLGSRNRRRTTVAALDAIAQGAAERILEAMINEALAGNPVAGKLLMERLWPSRRGCPVPLDFLPGLHTAGDAPQVVEALYEAARAGLISPEEATALIQLPESYVRLLAAQEMENRLAAVEHHLGITGRLQLTKRLLNGDANKFTN